VAIPTPHGAGILLVLGFDYFKKIIFRPNWVFLFNAVCRIIKKNENPEGNYGTVESLL